MLDRKHLEVGEVQMTKTVVVPDLSNYVFTVMAMCTVAKGIMLHWLNDSTKSEWLMYYCAVKWQDIEFQEIWMFRKSTAFVCFDMCLWTTNLVFPHNNYYEVVQVVVTVWMYGAVRLLEGWSNIIASLAISIKSNVSTDLC